MKKNVLPYEMFQEKICNNTYNAMAALIENCYYTQLALPPNFPDRKSSWKEYCTVKLCTARRAGHSTAICKVAFDYFKKAMILTPKEDMALRLRAEFPNVIGKVNKVEAGVVCKDDMAHTIRINDDNEYYFHTTNRIEHLRGIEFEAVFVDCASFVSKEKIEKIYENLGPSMIRHSQNFFIFVQ